ncbi:MAG: NADP-dependent oxidoreductase [Caulobacterales bacterium]|nr:NADP-dependent oxidoreductase [Caulobacterales bacterium]
MKQTVLARALDAKPAASDFRLIDAPMPLCPDEGVVMRVVHLSLDPYVGARLRGRHMGEPPPRPGQDPIPGGAVGQVVESRRAGLEAGAWVVALNAGWREYAPLGPGEFRVIDPGVAPLSAHVGVLGMPGLTGWAGMTKLAEAGPGDVVLVDAAAGPVGGTAGQIAKIKGAAKVIGVAGGPEKCALVTDVYGFDACVDYKAPDWRDRLTAEAGDGLSVHFENVSVAMLTEAMTRLREYGRVVLCGMADHYHSDEAAPGVPAGLIIGKRAALKGLVVYDFYDRWDAFLAEAAPWVAEGRLRFAEDRREGLESAPALMERLMNGANVGKAVVTVSPEQG